MAGDNTYKGLVVDWQRLLRGMEENADLLRDMTEEKAALEQALALAQERKAQQDLHVGEKQRTTQLLGEALAQGKEAARQARLLVKLRLGSRNEKLSQFRIAPLRKRASRKTTPTGAT